MNFIRLTERLDGEGGTELRRPVLVALDRIAAVRQGDGGRTWLQFRPESGEAGGETSRDAAGSPACARPMEIAEDFEEVARRLEAALRGGIALAAKPEADDRPVSFLNLTERARHALYVHGVQTIGQLRELDDATLLAMKNFGRTSLREVRYRLQELDDAEGRTWGRRAQPEWS